MILLVSLVAYLQEVGIGMASGSVPSISSSLNEEGLTKAANFNLPCMFTVHNIKHRSNNVRDVYIKDGWAKLRSFSHSVQTTVGKSRVRPFCSKYLGLLICH